MNKTEPKTEIVYDDKTQRFHAIVDGEIRHKSKTQESAQKTIDTLLKVWREQNAMEQFDTPIVQPVAKPPEADPFANAKEIKVKYERDPEFLAKTGIDIESLIPKKDPTYIPFGNYDDVEEIIKTNLFYPMFISGPSGNGKSSMVEQICAKHKKPLVRINFNNMVDEDILIGSKTLRNGNVEIAEGPVLIAMRSGATLLLDEIDAGAPNTLMCLQPVLEGKPYYFKLKNELVSPAPGFNIIATANTKGKGSVDGRFIGTNVLNEAFLERFAVTFNQEYPNIKLETQIVDTLMKAYGIEDLKFAQVLAKWSDTLRKTFDTGGIDETMSTRRLAHVVRSYAIYRNRYKAVELCCNRFDPQTKKAFLDVFTKLCPDEFNIKK
jgi:hypothetical protein